MRYIIKSRKYGEQSFWCNDKGNKFSSGYIYLEDTGPGTLGSQICEKGCFRGNTLSCNGTYDGLKKVADLWWRYRREMLREYDYETRLDM